MPTDNSILSAELRNPEICNIPFCDYCFSRFDQAGKLKLDGELKSWRIFFVSVSITNKVDFPPIVLEHTIWRLSGAQDGFSQSPAADTRTPPVPFPARSNIAIV